jgi:hypothetical protein
MTDPFAAYAETAAPAIPDRRADRLRKNPSALDLKMAEKSRLTKAYRIMKRAERIEILANEPRLLGFMRYLRSVGPEDGGELLEALGASDWLPKAPQSVRGFALQRIARRQDKIKLMLGLVPLDDPLPPETSVFFEAQKLLRAGGPL